MTERDYLKGYYLDTEIIDPSLSYTRCPTCGLVTKDHQMTSPEYPCPSCNTTGQVRTIWPEEIRCASWLSMIRDMMKKGEDRQQDEMEKVASELSKLCDTAVNSSQVEPLLKRFNASLYETLKDGSFPKSVTSALPIPQESFYGAFAILVEAEPVAAEHKVVVILTVTLCEVLLNDFLAHALHSTGVRLQTARRRVGALKTFAAKDRLFSRIASQSIADAINSGMRESKATESFYDDFHCIREHRNLFVHGSPEAISRDDAWKAFSVAVESFPVFASMFNEHCRSQRATPAMA
jgi:hypothetical protein